METKTITEMIKSTKGKFFSVTFVRKDGVLRKMTARIGVRKGVNGKGLAFNPSEKDLMVVWDTGKKEFRMVNLKTINTMKIAGVTHNLSQFK
jgi:hypothetical protein